MRAVVLRDGRLEVRETADPVPGAGRTAAQAAERRDLRVGRALHGPPEFGAAVRVGLRSRHHHGS